MTHLTLSDCDSIIYLSDVEIRRLLALLHSRDVPDYVRIGRFGSSIGTGVLIEFDREHYDITDYDSW